MRKTLGKLLAFSLVCVLLSQMNLAMAVTATYRKYVVRFSANTTTNTRCIKQLPPLYFTSSKTTSQSTPALSVDNTSVYRSMMAKQRDASNTQFIRYTDEAYIAGLSSAILLKGITDRAANNSHGIWSYDGGQCAGTFSMDRLSTRR